MLTAALIVVNLILISVWVVKRYRQMTLLSRIGIPGPKPNFILGNLLNLFGEEGQVKIHEKLMKQYGNIVGFYYGPKPVVLVNDVDFWKQVYIKDFHKFSSRMQIIKSGGSGHPKEMLNLIGQEGNKWKQQRSILTPTFSSSKLKSMTPMIDSAVDEFIENIEKKSKLGVEFDIYDMFQALTMDVIGRTAFGIKTNVQDQNTKHPFMIAAKNVITPGISQGLLLISIVIPELDSILFPFRRLQALIQDFFGHYGIPTLFKLCEQTLKQRRSNPHLKRKDLLQLMIDAKAKDEDEDLTNGSEGNGITKNGATNGTTNGTTKAVKHEKQSAPALTDGEIESNSVVFLEAGFETTSTLLGFVAHIFVNYPEIQEKVRQEIEDVCESINLPDGKIGYEEINKLNYLECVLHETLRFYPPITTFVTREAQEDYKYGDLLIPAGVAVMPPIYSIHHDPNLWPEPEKFDPDRFLPENRSEIHAAAWQPFGLGPRNCIGLRFAMLEAKLALARILTKFRLSPAPKTEIGDITIEYKPFNMTPKNGVYVKAVPI